MEASGAAKCRKLTWLSRFANPVLAPLAMDPALVKAHDALDKLVDRAFGAKKKLASNDERSKVLFDQYAAMTAE